MNKRYKKLCSRAKKLQETWEPNKGDLNICGCSACMDRNAEGHFVTDYEYDALTNRDLTNVDSSYKYKYIGQNFADAFRETKELIIWLPTQEQLQDLLRQLPKYRETRDIALLSKMRTHMSKEYCNTFLNTCSISEMWLCFYMHEAFGSKYLNEEKGWV